MFSKCICLAILCLLVLVGCAAYTPKIAEPIEETDTAAWLAYYQDQFKAFGNKVEPPKEDASEAQRLAYMEAQSAWKRRKGLEWGVAIGALVLGALLWLPILSSS